MRYYDRWLNHNYNWRKDVRHRQTCPRCGLGLVNTYRRADKWMCKRCWDEVVGQ